MKKLLILLLVMACGPDLILGPGDNVAIFPPVDGQTLRTYCIAGQIVPPVVKTGGVVALHECTRVQAWRLRVEETRRYFFDVSAGFNWGIGLYQVNVTEGDEQYAKYVPVNPALAQDTVAFTYTLEQFKEYAIVIVGRRQGDTGSYQLQIN